jgi:hypothetical protein
MAAINVRNLTDRRNFSRAMSATQPTSLHQTCNAEYVIGNPVGHHRIKEPRQKTCRGLGGLESLTNTRIS